MDGANVEDLQTSHRVVFRVVGAAKYRKRNLIQFDGYDFSKRRDIGVGVVAGEQLFDNVKG
jgi:hypothetical protein